MSRFAQLATLSLMLLSAGCQHDNKHSDGALEIRAADVVEHKKWTKTSEVVGGSRVWMAPKAAIDQSMVQHARAVRDRDGNDVVLVTLDSRGRAAMEHLCTEQESRPVAVLVDGKIVAVPVLIGRLDGEFVVGNPEWTEKDARDFADRLNENHEKRPRKSEDVAMNF